MRRLVLEFAAERGPIAEIAAIDHQTLAAADEVFICNSQFGVVPVTSIEQPHEDASTAAGRSAKQLPPGPVTRGLMDGLRQRGYAEIA